MIQIPQNPQPFTGIAPIDGAEPAEEANPNSTAAPGEQVPAGQSMAAADPLARFSATNGLHADVREFAGTQHIGNGVPNTAQTPVAHAKGGSPNACIAPHAGAFNVATTTQEQIDALKTMPISQKELAKLKHMDISAVDLERLKKSSNPAKREQAQTIEQDRRKALDIEGRVRLGFTIENAQVAYRDLIKQGGTVIATTSEANAGQPVLTLTGPRFRCDLPATIHTHYHGDNATVADPVGSKAGTTSRIMAVLDKEDPQAVFVLPEASNAPHGVDSPENQDRNDYGNVNWRNVTSQAQTTGDALAAAGVSRIGEQVVSFHSGGGKVVEALMKVDPSGKGLKADRLELYDCLYGQWQDSFVAWGKTVDPKALKSVVYFHGTNEGWRGAVVEKAFGDKFWKVDMQDQGPVQHKDDPIYHDANNKTYPRDYVEVQNGKRHVRHDYVRNFHENPHYRTMGEFFASKFDLRYL